MKSHFECDTDTLFLTDREYLNEFTDSLLYKLDILLDHAGKTELIYDFPNEKWQDVWKRETEGIAEICKSGKMVIFSKGDNGNLEICFSQSGTQAVIEAKSGKLILADAEEFVQCLAYPELEMQFFLEINIEPGIYLVTSDTKKLNAKKQEIKMRFFAVKTINDKAFGKLQYDYFWGKEETINFGSDEKRIKFRSLNCIQNILLEKEMAKSL